MSDTVFDVYFPCFEDIFLSVSLSLSLSLSLSVSVIRMCSSFLSKCMSRRLMPYETHGWLRTRRTCKVVRTYRMCQAWEVITKSAFCDVVVKYIQTFIGIHGFCWPRGHKIPNVFRKMHIRAPITGP